MQVITTSDSELLSTGPLKVVRLDLTTRCNLRCVYCAVSQSTYHGVDMPLELAHKATARVIELSEHHDFNSVHINGHGETTFLDGWTDVCMPLLDHGLRVVITTNLAKEYSREELAVLARMHAISVSIDTSDRDLLRRTRRSADVRQIVTNINMIRMAALAVNRDTPPSFEFSCGLYDKNSLLIEDFARFAVALRIDIVGFWNMTTWTHETFPYQNTNVPSEDRAYPLDTLSPDELRPRIDAIRRSISFLRNNGVIVHVAGNFVENLGHQLDAPQPGTSETSKPDSVALPAGMTRDCVDPWTYFELGTDGSVAPCCAHSPVGNLHHNDLPEIMNGEPISRLRSELLTGATDSYCTNCTLRGAIQPSLLKEKVRALLQERSSFRRVSAPAERPGQAAADAANARVTNLFNRALEFLKSGQEVNAWTQVMLALSIDPATREIVTTTTGPIQATIGLVTTAEFAVTLSGLAAMCRETGDRENATRFMKRYLEIAPNAPDREHVLADIEREKQWARQALRERQIHDFKSRVTGVWFNIRRVFRLRTRVRQLARYFHTEMPGWRQSTEEKNGHNQK